MTGTADSALGYWTAEFRAPATEAAYRAWNHRSATAVARFVAILVILASIPHIYGIHLRFGPGAEFQTLLAFRLSVTLLGCVLLVAAWRGVSYPVLDKLVLANVAGIILQTILLSLYMGPVMNILDFQFILLLLFVYVFAPTRFVYKALPCGILSAVFLAQIVWQFDLPDAERVGLAGWMIAANFFGIYTSYRAELLRRREFANRERLRRTNADLSTANLELRRARAEAERENKAKSVFLANVSHELRTPLNAINGFSEIMKHELFGPVGDARYRGYVTDIHDSGTYLLSLINDLLDLAKVEAGKLELQEDEVQVADLVDGSVRLLRDEAARNGVRFEVEVPAGLPPLWADERACRQILLNLLSNAVKFSPAGGTVAIRAAIRWTGGLLLRIADSGSGIAPDEVEKVLQPFGQARQGGPAGLGAGPHGTGLGLPLAVALVQAHGGSLSLESAPGGGTLVEVRLPPERLAQVRGDDGASALPMPAAAT